MASSNFVGGSTVSKSEPAKQEAISLECRMVIGIDANHGPSLLEKEGVNYFSHGIENPNKETIPQCDSIEEEFLYCDISSDINSAIALYRKIDSVISLIKKKLRKYSKDARYKEIYVPIYILGKAIDKLVSDIFYVITINGDEEEIKNKIKNLLSPSTYMEGNIKKNSRRMYSMSGTSNTGRTMAYGADPQVIRLQLDKERSWLDKLNIVKTFLNSLKKHGATNFFEENTEHGQSYVDSLDK